MKSNPKWRILHVCTANVCRSAMAEGMLRARLGRADVLVRSAGTASFDLPVDPVATRAAAELGVDIAGHQPRQLTADLLEAERPDLIITMTRAHLRAVVGLDKTLWPITFTLRDLARRTSALADDPQSFDDWLRRVGEGRRAADVVNDDPDDDIADPYGRGFETTMATARELDMLTRTIASLGSWS